MKFNFVIHQRISSIVEIIIEYLLDLVEIFAFVTDLLTKILILRNLLLYVIFYIFDLIIVTVYF